MCRVRLVGLRDPFSVVRSLVRSLVVVPRMFSLVVVSRMFSLVAVSRMCSLVVVSCMLPKPRHHNGIISGFQQREL